MGAIVYYTLNYVTKKQTVAKKKKKEGFLDIMPKKDPKIAKWTKVT